MILNWDLVYEMFRIQFLTISLLYGLIKLKMRTICLEIITQPILRSELYNANVGVNLGVFGFFEIGVFSESFRC